MDKEQQPTYINHTSSIHTPAHLWIGPSNVTLHHTKLFLQKKFCPALGCRHCIVCTQIDHEQHHALMWLTPEKQYYTLEQLTPIFETISFALNDDEHYFFIIQKADFLSLLCANRLLKLLEEPPAGYSFILLAQNSDALLPTIRSRCIIKTLTNEITHAKQHALVTCLTEVPPDPFSFLQALEEITLNERESTELLNTLLLFWLEQTKKSIFSNNKKEQHTNNSVVALLRQAFHHLPMPGSSKLFWRNIFLKMQDIKS